MPCWERREQTVDLAVANTDLLADAFAIEGWSVHARPAGSPIVNATRGGVRASYRDGRLTYESSRGVNDVELTSALKRSYSRAAIKRATAKAGFTLKIEGKKLVAVRRRY